jgi:hypothetical protein
MDIVDGRLLIAKLHTVLDIFKVDVVLCFVSKTELLETIDKALGTGFGKVLRVVMVVCEERSRSLVVEEGCEFVFCGGECGVGVGFDSGPQAVADDFVRAHVGENGGVGFEDDIGDLI